MGALRRGHGGLTSSQGLIGVGGCLWHQGCLWQQLLLSLGEAGSAEGHRFGRANVKSWHGAPVLTATLLCWGVRRAVGMPGFTTKRLAPWRLLARVSWLARMAGMRLCSEPPFPDSRPGLSPSRPAGGGGIRGALPPWRGRSRPGRAGDAGWHRPAPGQSLLPCRAGSGGMEGPGGKGRGCRAERAVLALSQAEIQRNRLALSGKGERKR